jgi:hypothetical protein
MGTRPVIAAPDENVVATLIIAAVTITRCDKECTQVHACVSTGAAEDVEGEGCWQCGVTLCDWIENSSELLVIVDEKLPMSTDGVKLDVLTIEKVLHQNLLSSITQSSTSM